MSAGWTSPTVAWVAALVAGLVALPLLVSDAYILHVMILIGINVMVAVSMWLLGVTGLISFGQAGFMFIGAMTTALLTKSAGWPFWLALPLSALVPALIAAPVGRLSLRVRGVYFFLVTLAFGQVVNGVFAYFQDPFGGWYGIRDIPRAAAGIVVHDAQQGPVLLPVPCPDADHRRRGVPRQPIVVRQCAVEHPRKRAARCFGRHRRAWNQADRLRRGRLVRRRGGQLLCCLLRLYQSAGVHLRILGEHADLHRGGRVRLDRRANRRRGRADAWCPRCSA